jgi:hypothetical protein
MRMSSTGSYSSCFGGDSESVSTRIVYECPVTLSSSLTHL